MKQLIIFIIFLIFPVFVHGQEQCGHLIEKGWRGMDCFHCMHPNAQGGTSPINDLLTRSCLKKVMIAFVVDGSFGYNEAEIKKSIDALTASGRELWLHLYVFNGPAQRRWESGVFQSFAVMDPYVFQSKILNDKKLQNEFINIVKERIAPVVSYAASKGAKISIAPGLEDNLSDAGYKKALSLVQKNVPKGIKITYVRNHCFRCAAGNGRALPPKVILEEHDDLLFNHRWDGIINTDGRYFKFSSEKSSLPSLFDLAPSWLASANNQRNAFLLWVPHFQDTPISEIPRPLWQRNFRGPTEDEAAEIIDFLQY
jgi:hypothetical protein